MFYDAQQAILDRLAETSVGEVVAGTKSSPVS
jgi:hypothetical protein